MEHHKTAILHIQRFINFLLNLKVNIMTYKYTFDKITRRQFLTVCGIGTLYLGIPSLGTSSLLEAKTLEKIEFAMSTRNITVIRPLLAMHLGFFREEGVDPTERFVNSNELGTSLVTKNLHIGDIPTDYVFQYNAKREEPVIKIVAGSMNRTAHYFIARKKTRAGKIVKTPEDLRGSIIGIPSRGGGSHLVLRAVLRQYGLEEGRDYTTFKTKGGFGTITALVAQGKEGVDAVTISSPWNFLLAEQRDKYIVLGDTLETVPYHQFKCLAAHGEWAQAHRDLVVKFLKAYVRACQYFYKEKDKVIEFASNYFKFGGFSKEKIREFMEKSWYWFVDKEIFSKDGGVTFKGLETIVAMQEDSKKARELTPGVKVNERPFNIQKNLDLSYLEEAQRSLGLSPIRH